MRRPFMAGNWKMNMLVDEAVDLVKALRDALDGYDAADAAVCPPFVDLPAVVDALKGSSVGVGGQNIFWEDSGAFTGEVSGPMLKSVGVQYVIIGHSERRQYFGETDETVVKRLAAALKHELKPIVCVGETLEEREADKTSEVVSRQVSAVLQSVTADQAKGLTLAYEPVWAIGTGKTASPEQAEEVHALIRKLIADTHGQDVADMLRIQYGGSVKPSNVKELMACENVDGALVGGASLKADDFIQIVKFAE